MLSLVLLAFDAPGRPVRPKAVARSLASLVEACVSGLVGDAVLVGLEGRGLDKIADQAGCALIESASRDDGLVQALALARSEHILLLDSDYAIGSGFIDEVSDALNSGAPRALILRATPNSLLTRLAPQFAPIAGLIAPKTALRAAGGADLSRLVRQMKGADLSTRARHVF